jgi:hypothetical protein
MPQQKTLSLLFYLMCFLLKFILPTDFTGEPLTNSEWSYIGICSSPRATGGDGTENHLFTKHNPYRCRHKMFMLTWIPALKPDTLIHNESNMDVAVITLYSIAVMPI